MILSEALMWSTYFLLLSALLNCRSATCQKLTPFTFRDVQRRVGVAAAPANVTTFQADVPKTTFQTDSSQAAAFDDDDDDGDFFKASLGGEDFFKIPSFADAAGDATFQSSATAAPNVTSTSTSNPFEPLLSDPSSFVSSLTSLHLHLTEPRRERADGDRPDEATDLFSTSFGFSDSDFGSRTSGGGFAKPGSDLQVKPDQSSGRGFPEVAQPEVEEDSSADESRNGNNFFANPFKFDEPLFGSANPGFAGQQANLGLTGHQGFASQAAAGSSNQETLSRDGDHHGGGGGGGGYHAPVHDDGGYEAPHQDSGGYGAPVHDDGGYGAPVHDSGGYGHAEPAYHDDGGGYGGDVHHEGGYSSHPGYTPTRQPGPYGYPTPNFKCEYVKETLYVSKSDWTYDEKCFTIYKTQCRMEYDVGKDIGYKKECNEFSVTKCRTEYDTSSETKCKTVYRKECGQIYVTKVDWEYEEKCETSYEEHCHGYGYEKKCDQVPKEMCHQVPVKVEKQIPKTECKKVPDKKCTDVPIFIPRKACKDFPKTVCTKDPINVPKKIPKKVCYSVPKEVCNKIPVQIIKHVPKTVTKKVCVSTKPSGYGHVDAGYSSHGDAHGGFSEQVLTVVQPSANGTATASAVAVGTGNGNSTLPAEVRSDLEEQEPEVYYDEIEESDYLADLDEVFDKS